MEFFFEVDPDLDIAVGTEFSAEDMEAEVYDDGDFVMPEQGPLSPTGAKPGSEDKVRMLAARYAAGVPLWHESDCYDHGPDAVSSSNEFDDPLDLDEF